MRLHLPFVLALTLAVAPVAFPGRATAQLAIEVAPGAAYTVEVWTGDVETARAIEVALRSRTRPVGARGQAMLRDHAGRTLALLTAWPSAEAAAGTEGSPYFPAAETYWRRAFAMTGSSAKAGESFTITSGSHVQWSEFLMRDPRGIGEFAEMVGGITDSMAEGGGAAGLRAIARMQSTHGTSLALLGLWTEREGFKVFERDATFGPDPYWAPFADNAHWMMDVALTR